MRRVKQVIAVRKDLNMRKGKIGAQCGHAAMMFLMRNREDVKAGKLVVNLSEPESIWFREKFTKVVVGVDSADELEQLVLRAKLNGVEANEVIDSGATEFHGEPTLTCAAFGPDYEDVIDEITGHLKLI